MNTIFKFQTGVTFPEPLLFMVFLGREKNQWDGMVLHLELVLES